MIKTQFFNDAPITSPEEDNFGVNQFAKTLSQSFRNIKLPIGTTVAINGSWGSGKSSAINLIRYHLKDIVKDGKLEIVDFKCWWFRGEEALTLAFLQQLNASLEKSLRDKAKDLIPRISKALLQSGPVIRPLMNLTVGGDVDALTAGSIDFVKQFFDENEGLEKIFYRLSEALKKQRKKFLVIIDDIDRLTPDEAILIFRLIKSVGQLPNVMYLLAFDRELAEKTVAEKYPSEGPHFLEKIIQANFELPLPDKDDLNTEILSQIENICGPINDREQILRFMNIFYDAVSPYFSTPRDLVRLSNSMAVSWPAVSGEVNIEDYVALETMKLFEPKLYNAVRLNKGLVCGSESGYNNKNKQEQELEAFLDRLPENRRERAKIVLKRLFPSFENTSYSSDFKREWNAQRRVCSDKYFYIYFRMGICNETISINEIEDFITNAGDQEYVKAVFLKALSSIRKNGKSKVPLWLDEINVHAQKIEKAQFQSLISTMFSIADDINRSEDKEKGGFSIGDNHLRIHWLIRRLTFDRCDLEERSVIFSEACKNAQIGWLVDFVSSAIGDYFPRQGEEPRRSEECLVAKEHLPELKSLAINTIKSAAETGNLISHSQLLSILYRWKEFLEDNGDTVKDWTKQQLKLDKSVSMLAKAFTSESWSHSIGMFGLGDRVAMKKLIASDGLEKIVDVKKFRHCLEKIEKSETVKKDLKENVVIFLDAWRRRESGIDK